MRPDELPAQLDPEVTALHAASIALFREPGATLVEMMLQREHARGKVTVTLDPNIRHDVIGDPGGDGRTGGGRRRQGRLDHRLGRLLIQDGGLFDPGRCRFRPGVDDPGGRPDEVGDVGGDRRGAVGGGIGGDGDGEGG